MTALVGPPLARSVRALPLRARSSALLAVASLIGLAAFFWPLFYEADGSENAAHAGDAPWIFVALLPLLLLIVLAEVADGGLDAKAIALLGVLAACGGMMRLPGGGPLGGSAVFFLLIPAGRVLGRSFGFVLGALTIFASAVITAGIGPWLPFQMFGAAWLGFGAGCLPPARGRVELALLAAYGFLAGLLYGFLLDLWFWPFVSGSELSFVPGDAVLDNLGRFAGFHAVTALGYDIPRGVTIALLIAVAGRPVLLALRRAARRAAFGAAAEFDPRPMTGLPR
ncbi:MAG TPA: ECF transporter S component [Mycobacteriales bacterium]|nr:ECF transporter S component [Mycobacteriales bacterium]